MNIHVWGREMQVLELFSRASASFIQIHIRSIAHCCIDFYVLQTSCISLFDISDKITCPKDVKDRKDRKHQYYQPYKKPHNKKIHDKRSERRDQEIFEKRHGFHHESDKRSSEGTICY